MILKMDYARVYELVLAELVDSGYDNMTRYLAENPPKTYNGRLFSVDLAEALVSAKGNENFKLSTLDAIRNHSNLRLMLNNADKGEWFNELKAIMKPQLDDPELGAKIISNLDLINEDDPDEDDPCDCDVEDCDERATWKCFSHCERKVCGRHMSEEGRDEHEYIPWDCDTDEFYDYIEDVPGATR